MRIWGKRGRKRQRDAPPKEANPAASPDGEGGSDAEVETRLIERLQRLDLPEPPPGAKERGLKRLEEWLERESRRSSR